MFCKFQPLNSYRLEEIEQWKFDKNNSLFSFFFFSVLHVIIYVYIYVSSGKRTGTATTNDSIKTDLIIQKPVSIIVPCSLFRNNSTAECTKSVCVCWKLFIHNLSSFNRSFNIAVFTNRVWNFLALACVRVSVCVCVCGVRIERVRSYNQINFGQLS